MRQNFRRDKIKKEEMRKKKQEEKRNKRLQKRDPSSAPGLETPVNPEGIETSGLGEQQVS